MTKVAFGVLTICQPFREKFFAREVRPTLNEEG